MSTTLGHEVAATISCNPRSTRRMHVNAAPQPAIELRKAGVEPGKLQRADRIRRAIDRLAAERPPLTDEQRHLLSGLLTGVAP